MARHDQTKWLTHFVRDRVPSQDFPGSDEDDCGIFQGGELEADASAFSVLKAIIRLGGIMPGYSFRNGRTTIYGGAPAVCATEMPLYSFAQYAKARHSTGQVSAYGISMLKSEFYQAGGRHVIYGLSTDWPTFEFDTATVRIFHDTVLPRAEQYRYVAYNPTTVGRFVDWTHEREWRWIARDEDADEIWVQDYNGQLGSTPALPIFKGRLDGRPFSQLCIIVWTTDEAAEVRELLTGLYLAGSNNYDTQFDKRLIEASKIIVLQDVVDAVEKSGNLHAQTIEGLAAANLLQSIDIPKTPVDAAQRVADALKKAGVAARKAITDFQKDHGQGGGYCGFAHATTYAVTDPLVQYMLANDLANGPYDGRVWIKVPTDYPPSQSLDYQEAACEAASTVLTAELGVSVYCESRGD